MAKEDEYKEIFLGEAIESCEELNNLFTELEKDITNKAAIDAIFRVTHTLKGNAMGMGFHEIAELSHAMEDIFNEVKSQRLKLTNDIFTSLFKANDILGQLIHALKTGESVKYKGIKTKLEVLLKNTKSATTENDTPETTPPVSELTEQELPEAGLTQEVSEIELEEDSTDQDDSDLSEQKIVISDVVQVPVRKLDALLNIVGELIIEKDTLTALNIERGFQSNDLARLNRITSDLQYGVMDVRLVQIGFLFNKFSRILRDAAQIEGKKVDLVLEGTEIEIDRNILRIISDSLVHLVRNSVSHGIESPESRLAKGKPEAGKVTLSARNEKDTVFIDVIDDGNGIDPLAIRKKAVEKGILTSELAKSISDEESIMYIFEPGFSNAEKVTEISGRGVGMDVVKRAVESIGGKVSVTTEKGTGSTFTLSLPSSMAVKGALLFELNTQQFAIALSNTEAVISLRKRDLHKINNGLISNYLDKNISVIFLKDLFNMGNHEGTTLEELLHKSFDELNNDQKLDVVMVSYNKHLVGLVVDKLLQQKEIVEKALKKPVDENKLFSGATILGDGSVCLVLDVVSILSRLFRERINVPLEALK